MLIAAADVCGIRGEIVRHTYGYFAGGDEADALMLAAKIAQAIEEIVRCGVVGPVVAGVVDDGVEAEAGGVVSSDCGEFVAVEEFPTAGDEGPRLG